MATSAVPLSEDDRGSGSPSQRSQTSVDDPDSFDLTGPNPTRDALADGIVSLLSPTLKTLDEGFLSTKRSQEELSEQIALLTDQLKLISAEHYCPIDLDGYVTRLGNIKGKINVISSVLHSAQERLNKVHEQALREAARRKPLIEPSPVLSPHSSQSSVARDNNENPTEEEDQPIEEPSASNRADAD
ncbi:unnamed protein product [Allacma fusca]|uniref:Biogenesis of lysosome-related organelles complex 1 subunit 7 n=1 Tax=Allacma fusca TaxID=39272 RepID=A0A8J2JS76_9HEXA|nr:unnamed protein product [Allacma fusca]